MILNFLFIFFEKCLKGFELKEQDILNSGKFTLEFESHSKTFWNRPPELKFRNILFFIRKTFH